MVTNGETAAVVIVDFDSFYVQTGRRRLSLAYSLTGSWGDAEDLVQEAYAAAHRRWNVVGSYDDPAAWVRRVITNRAVSRWRRLSHELNVRQRLAARGVQISTAAEPEPSRLYWLLTDLPDEVELVQMSEPGSQVGPPGATVMVNVYATDAAPLGPILSVSGSLGRGLDIVPAADGANFRETTIDGRRAAFADSETGQRLLYLEVDGHWVVMTSMNIDDPTLSKMAQAVVRDADGTAKVPVAALLDDLTLVLPDDAPSADLGMGSDFSGITYAHPDGPSISLAVYPSRPSSRQCSGCKLS